LKPIPCDRSRLVGVLDGILFGDRSLSPLLSSDAESVG
jgi:hypothetical protein